MKATVNLSVPRDAQCAGRSASEVATGARSMVVGGAAGALRSEAP
jgi:hypothetical protein